MVYSAHDYNSRLLFQSDRFVHLYMDLMYESTSIWALSECLAYLIPQEACHVHLSHRNRTSSWVVYFHGMVVV